MRTIRAVTMVAVLLLAVAGCSGDPSPGPSASSSASPSSGATEVPDPTLSPGKRPSRYVGTVSGTRDLGECLLLRTTGGLYVLVGDTGGLSPGDEAEVSAVADKDAATTCQQGPVLRVVEVIAVGG